MKSKIPKNLSFYSIIFSLLFLPLRIKLGNIFADSKNILQQSEVLSYADLEGMNTVAQGLNLTLPLSDLANFLILIFIFRKTQKVQKYRFFILSFIYLTIILGSFKNFLGLDQIIVINLYNLRFIFYTLLFLFESDVLVNFLTLLKNRITYIIPIFFLTYQLIDISRILDLPPLYNSRLEVFPPLLIFGITAFLYHKYNSINRSSELNIFLFLLITNYILCGKRGLLIPLLIVFAFFIFNEIRIRGIKYLFRFNFFNLLTLTSSILVLSFVLFRTIKFSPGWDTGEYIYLQNLGMDNLFLYLDGSTQERLAKFVMAGNVFSENPINLIIPSGINSFKLINNFITDSLLESFFSIGIFQTIYIIHISSNFKNLKNWIRLTSKSRSIIACFIPFFLIIGYGLTCNITSIIYIYPPFAFYNSLIDNQISKNLN